MWIYRHELFHRDKPVNELRVPSQKVKKLDRSPVGLARGFKTQNKPKYDRRLA